MEARVTALNYAFNFNDNGPSSLEQVLLDADKILAFLEADEVTE